MTQRQHLTAGDADAAGLVAGVFTDQQLGEPQRQPLATDAHGPREQQYLGNPVGLEGSGQTLPSFVMASDRGQSHATEATPGAGFGNQRLCNIFFNNHLSHVG
jgi:hypothetical protein